MFDIGSSELLLIAVVALLVIGPKDLPRVLHTIGQWMAKARAMTGHFKTGLEAMAREVEIEEMEKQWAAHNDRIMKEHPPSSDVDIVNLVGSDDPTAEPMLPLASTERPEGQPPDAPPAVSGT